MRRRHLGYAENVSIHAPARGATRNVCGCTHTRHGFNPRAREGRDGCAQARRLTHLRFNPRAREGRDKFFARRFFFFASFNPRAREGRDF